MSSTARGRKSAFNRIAQRRKVLSIVVLFLLATFVAGAFFAKRSQFHPYVVLQPTEDLKITFLQHGKPTRAQCEATANRVVEAVLTTCPGCRLLENRCVEKLDPRQRKILFGQPIDIPVMRISGGAIAFMASAPELALEACQESERQASRTLPGRTRCASPGFERLTRWRAPAWLVTSSSRHLKYKPRKPA